MDFFDDTDDLKPDLDQDLNKPKPPAIAVPPSETPKFKSTKLFSVVEVESDSEDIKPVDTTAVSDVSKIMDGLPAMDSQFTVVNDKAAKTVSLKELENTIMAQESVCRSDAEKISLVTEDFSIPAKRFTAVPTKVMFNEVIRELNTKVKVSVEETATGAIDVLKSYQGVVEQLATSVNGGFMAKDKDFLEQIKDYCKALDEVKSDPKKLRMFTLAERLNTINIISKPMVDVVSVLSNIQFDHGKVNDIDEFKSGIQTLANVINSSQAVSGLLMAVLEGIDIEELINDPKYINSIETAKLYSYIDIAEFYMSPSRAEFVTRINVMINKSLQQINGWLELLQNDKDNASEIVISQEKQMTQMRARISYMTDIISQLPVFDEAYRKVSGYIKLCLQDGFAQ